MSVGARRLLIALTLGTSVGVLAGCVGSSEMARRLQKATAQDQLPKVVACWEPLFEAQGFRGNYVAVVDFTVRGGSGKVAEVTVHDVFDITTGNEHPAGSAGKELKSCLKGALEESRLKKGKHMPPSSDVVVTDYRIAFRDAPGQARKEASEDAPNVLIGPRADRCQGLYSYDPPREAATLHGELAEARRRVTRYAGDDLDKYARALQASYDLALELRQRARLEGKRRDIPKPSRRRYREEVRRATDIANELGRKIGCKPPEL